MAQIILSNGAAPSAPSAGNVSVYSKTDKNLYLKDDSGTENQIATLLSVATSPCKLPTIGCTQAGGALTFSASSQYLDFRSTTLTSGAISTILCAPSNLVLPSGGTLGAVTTVSARIAVVEINNAGTAELAIVNIAGGNDLSETGVISTTAISAAATANNVFYSTNARTNVAYRVVGSVDAVNTAGAWGNPTLVQGSGGNALSAMSSLGYGQTWQNLTGSRAVGTTYYNTTGKPIYINPVIASNGGAYFIVVTINGVSMNMNSISTTNTSIGAFAVVPIGGSYSATTSAGTPALSAWNELR